MSRCQEFPPLGFVWNGVCGNDLIQLLKVRREKAEFEKKEKKKVERMKRKSSKREHKQDMHKKDKKRKIQAKKGSEGKLQDLKNIAEFQLKQLLENWVPPPPPIQSQQSESDDLHWLFDSRVPTRPKIETFTTSKLSLSPMNSVRALPYTLLY